MKTFYAITTFLLLSGVAYAQGQFFGVTVNSSNHNQICPYINFTNLNNTYYGMLYGTSTNADKLDGYHYSDITNWTYSNFYLISNPSNYWSGSSVSNYVGIRGATNLSASVMGLSSTYDTITRTLSITRTGTDNYAGNNMTNVGTANITNLNMRGNIALNSNWLSGDGGNEGLAVAAAGNVYTSGRFGIGTNSTAAFLHAYSVGNYQPQLLAEAHNNTAGSAPYFIMRRARLGPAMNQTGDTLGSFMWGSYTVAAYQNAAGMAATLDDVNTGSGRPATRMEMYTTVTNSADLQLRLGLGSAGELRLYNMTTGPGTPSGSTYLYSTNGEGYWKDASGNATLQTPHNEKGEMVEDSYNEFTGVREVLNITLLGRWVKANIPEPEASQIYWTTTNSTPKDWRQNEADNEAKRDDEMRRWTPEAGVFPAPYIKRPMPDVINLKSAQKQFDAKYAVEAPK